MCERELENEQNCNILYLLSIGHNSVSFPFSWAAQPGAWGPSLSGTCSSIQHLLSNCNCSIGARGPPLLGAGFLYGILPPNLISNCTIEGPEGPFCRVLFSLQHHFSNSSDLQLLNRGSRGLLLLGAVFSTA